MIVLICLLCHANPVLGELLVFSGAASRRLESVREGNAEDMKAAQVQ